MIPKETKFAVIECDILNERSLIKLAAEDKLPEPYDKDFLYIRVRAISAGEFWGPNRNSDFFPEDELKKCHPTFLEAHVFLNHQNKEVEKAVGSVLESTWNDFMKYVELLIKIDKKLAPSVVRGFEKNTITDVSMGAKVKQSICSICGNAAKTRTEFCDHVKKMRGEVLPDGRQVYEVNRGVRFHDISVVLNGADRTAKVVEKVAEERAQLEKAASFAEAIKGDYTLPQVEEDFPLLTKQAQINKFAEMKKRIIDRLYVISLLNKLKKAPKKEVEKTAGYLMGPLSRPFVGVRDAVLGASAVNMAANYERNQMLRGEPVTGPQRFLADNPGLATGAYLLGVHPVIAPLMHKAIDKAKMGQGALIKAIKHAEENFDTVLEKVSSDPINIFSKEAAELPSQPFEDYIDPFKDNSVCDIMKRAYNYNSKQVDTVKQAAILYESKREDVVDQLLKKAHLSYSDLGNFLKVAQAVVDEDVAVKLAAISVGRNMLEDSLFVPNGRLAAALPAMVIDGIAMHAITKHFDPKEEEVTRKQLNSVQPPTT